MARLSHSSIEKYKTCPRLWYNHYIEKLRDKQIGSPLFLGSAIDEALNALLLKKMKPENMTEEDKEFLGKCPLELFDEKFSLVNYNKEDLDMVANLKARYSVADFDADLLQEDDIEDMGEFLKENGYEEVQDPILIMLNIKKYIKNHGYIELDDLDQTYYAYCNWLSLRRKGHMMIETYEKELMPLIYEVVSIQKKIELPNGEGDTIIGYIDFEAILFSDEIDEHGRVPDNFVTVCDNKTSSIKYKENSVKESQQLTIYCEAQELQNAAYFVLNKKVRKTKEKTCKKCGKVTTRAVKKCAEGGTGKNRCNGDFDLKIISSIDTQVIKDEIDEEFTELTFDVIQDILGDIREEAYEKVEQNNCFLWGRKCLFHERCWKDSTSMKGIICTKEEE